MAFCLTGKVGIVIDDKEFVLNKGDAVLFGGTGIHNFFNAANDKERPVALCVRNTILL